MITIGAFWLAVISTVIFTAVSVKFNLGAGKVMLKDPRFIALTFIILLSYFWFKGFTWVIG